MYETYSGTRVCLDTGGLGINPRSATDTASMCPILISCGVIKACAMSTSDTKCIKVQRDVTLCGKESNM